MRERFSIIVASVLQDFRFALRQLRSAPAVTLTAVITLALGMGANTAMFSIVDAWLLRPLPLKDPSRLVAVWRTDPHTPREPTYFNLYHDYLVWAASNRTMESVAASFDEPYVLTGAGDAVELHGAVATWNLFSTVGANAEAGRLFVAADYNGEPACVISHALWVERFHRSPDVIGKSITLNGDLYRVMGVLTPDFSLHVLDRSFDNAVWVLITATDAAHTATSPTPVAVIGRLKPGVTAAQAEADLTALQQELSRRFSDYPPNVGVLVTGLQQDNTRAVRSSLLLLLAAVGVLLMMACVNASSLILGRNSRRETEFAIRTALGCSVRRLVQQLTTEVLVLFALGGALGIGVAIAAIRVFVASNPFGVLPPGGIHINGTVMAVSAATVGVTAMIFGALPAWQAHRRTSGETLNVRATTGTRAHLRSRMAVVTIQFALCMVLLTAAGLLIKTFAKIEAEPLGFQTRDVFVASVALPYRTYGDIDSEVRFTDNALSRLSHLPSVHAAGVARTWPFEVNGLNPIELESAHDAGLDQMPQAARFVVGPGYFSALGVPVLRGRAFESRDRDGSLPVAIINDVMARAAFPTDDPIGKRVRLRYLGEKTATEPWVTIIGVVGTTRSLRYNHIDWNSYPAVYTSEYQLTPAKGSKRFASRTLYFYVQGAAISARAISDSIHDLDPNLAVGKIESTGEIVSGLRSQPRIRAEMTGMFGLITLLLAAVGIYGVITQMVEQRGREIGIRIAIGATARDVKALVLRRTGAVTAVGIAAGVALAAVLSRVVRTFLYGTTALDPAVLGAVVAVLAVVAIVASYMPMRRAVRIDPSVTLHNE